MKFRTLDGNWDWNFGLGLGNYADNSIAVSYDLKSKILSWYGDCFFDTTAGIDWKNYLGSKNKKEQIDKAIKQIVISEPDVAELVYFDSTIENRTYLCDIKVKTIYGETIEVKI
ncbi:MAG: hypothetical protein KBT03_09500 [Bacteroidales bacterium]|nr:hypothetical protein [Candidatus Scybalousia scybalohippi]